MYSLEEVNQALEKDKLSDALYKMERFATAQGLTILEKWCSDELNGYSNSGVSDKEKDEIEKYRYVGADWKDYYGRIITISPELAQVHKLTVWQGVIELESYEVEGMSLIIPKLIDLLNQFSNVPVSKASISSEQTKALIKRIRAQARKKWHDNLPRVPNKKVIYHAPSFTKLVSDADLARILLSRWNEANLAFESGAYLATVILLGSILEGVLLDKVEQNQTQATASSKCPRDRNGTPLPFEKWTLEKLIEVTHDCGWLKKEAKDFSHVVRDYRNFVHPNKERREGIKFEEPICKVVWEVVSVALT